MPTSKLDRLNKLFEGGKRIAQADPNKPHIADLEFMPETSATNQNTPNPAPAEGPCKIPQVAQHLTEATPPPLPIGRELDLLTSSDEDEYVAAFSSRPTAKKPPIKSIWESRRGGYHGVVMRREDLTASAGDLSDHDVEGNPFIGHFCPLDLVAKFPYKYMVDPNERVSRHFFAQNKFYQRKWDL